MNIYLEHTIKQKNKAECPIMYEYTHTHTHIVNNVQISAAQWEISDKWQTQTHTSMRVLQFHLICLACECVCEYADPYNKRK